MHPKAKESDIVIQKLENEVLVYNLKTNKAFCLNQTSAAVWQRCNGENSVSEIASRMRREFDSSVDEDLVLLSLEQLGKDGLLEGTGSRSFAMNAVSRRDLIRKVGAASLVALPLVSSLIAPKSISAQSGCPIADNNMNAAADGCACIGANDCVSGCCGTVSGPRICAPVGADPAGSACRANCECANSCSGGVCT